MALTVKVVDLETFAQSQHAFPQANFLQSEQMARVQLERQNFLKTELLQVRVQDRVVGQVIANYRRLKRFFTEVVLFQGPLWQATTQAEHQAFLEALTDHFKKAKVSKISIYPYMTDKVLDNDLNPKVEELAKDEKAAFQQLGYKHVIDLEDAIVIGQMYAKPLDGFENKDAFLNSFSATLRQNIKKFEKTQVQVRELDESEIDVFYKIVSETGKRKGFVTQPLIYMTLMKKHFGDAVKYMVAYLDCKQYREYLAQNIADFQQRIAELSEKNPTKRNKGLIRDAEDQLGSYLKRQAYFESLNVKEDILYLSSYMFVCYGEEVISLMGGSYEEYINFGGSTLINWTMINYAYEQNFRNYNFYGTIETSQSDQNTGNFNYKKQFDGELNVLIGGFSKVFHPLLKLFDK